MMNPSLAEVAVLLLVLQVERRDGDLAVAVDGGVLDALHVLVHVEGLDLLGLFVLLLVVAVDGVKSALFALTYNFSPHMIHFGS